jgi:Tfp pilus assembly protein PilV
MKTQRGFNLVEVLIGMGITSGVVMAICSMHALAAMHISSGRQLSAATTFATEILEELAGVSGSRSAILAASGGSGATGASSDSRQPGSAAHTLWGPAAATRLHRGWTVVQLTPLGGNAAPPTFATADAVRATVEVGWDDRGRARRIRMDQAQFHE